MNYDNIPKYIRDIGKFCLWRYEERNGKFTKVPYQVNGCKAKPNNPSTFTTFETVMKSTTKFDGIGLGIFNGISAIDIDHCIDKDGNFSELAQNIVTLFDGCYVEKSPSGRGLRILFLATDFIYDKSMYYIHHPNLRLEVYVSGATHKYVTLIVETIYGEVHQILYLASLWLSLTICLLLQVVQSLLPLGTLVTTGWCNVNPLSIKVLSEMYMLNDEVGYIGFERLDGKLIVSDAIKVLQVA